MHGGVAGGCAKAVGGVAHGDAGARRWEWKFNSTDRGAADEGFTHTLVVIFCGFVLEGKIC